jgi:predicted permease
MGLLRRLAGLFRRGKISADLDEEFAYHLSMREEWNRDQGMDAPEARLAARRSFGNATLLKESTREAHLAVLLETVLKDLRFAARMLYKQKGFTALAVVALALGIGVNTAVFTAIKAVLLQPLDAANPRQLVNVYRVDEQRHYSPGFSYLDYEFFRDQNRSFSGLVATSGAELAMTAGGGGASVSTADGGGLAQAFGFRFPRTFGGTAQFVSAAIVSENYFATLGVNALRGRVFLPQDAHDLDLHPVILISENFWRRRFAGDPAILGRIIKLNGAPFEIEGITPHDFTGTIINVPNIWLPMRLWPLTSAGSKVLHDREDAACALYGRLQPGVTMWQAQAEMTILEERVRALHAPHSDGSKPAHISLTPGSHVGPVLIIGGAGFVFTMLLILGAVGLVLLIACANVSSLQLARSAARQKEIGIRLSIGASRFRIIRQLLTESALLGLLAGSVSLLMTWWVLRLLMLQVAAALPVEWGSVALHVEPDRNVFAYVFAISMVSSVLFGLASAIQSSRSNLAGTLKEEGGGFGLRISSSRMRDLLIATQAGASLFLLIAAGLLIRGSIRSMVISPGFETKQVLSLELFFPPGMNIPLARQLAEVNAIRERIGSLRGVTETAFGKSPANGGLRTAAVGLNGAKPSTDRTTRTVFYSYVTPQYFRCLDMPLLAGTGFAATASNHPEISVVLSESAAAEFWPGENAIGKKVSLDASTQFFGETELIPKGSVYEVIGVVRDARPITPQGDDVRKAYLALPSTHFSSEPLLIRFNGDTKTALSEFGQQIGAIDANIVVYANTVDELLTATPPFVITRLSAMFATLIGGLGLLLSCVGIYGTVSFAVARRTREVGIRMALGARKNDVLGLILRESGRPVMLGLAVGGIGAVGVSFLLHSLLFGLALFDPISFFGVGALFLAVALFAAYMPARRATMVDPTAALRSE